MVYVAKEPTQEIKKDLWWIEKCINSDEITKQQSACMREFDNYNKLRGIKPRTRCNYIKWLKVFARNVKKDPKKLTPKEVLNYFANLKSRDGRELAEHTLWNYQTDALVFFKWLERQDIFKEIMKIRRKQNKNGFLSREDLPTKKELLAIIKSAHRLRDKALIFTLYESAMRANECLNLRLGDIKINDNYAELTVRQSKSEQRIIPVINAVPLLRNWLNEHPTGNSEDFVWVSFKNGHKDYSKVRITIDSLQLLLRECAVRAGVKKRIFPHLLRHMRTTELMRSGMPDSMVKKITGHSAQSPMLARYGHLVSDDTKNFLLGIEGLSEEKIEKDSELLKVKACPRCKTHNSITNLYCDKCWLCLEYKQAIQEQEYEKDMQNFMMENKQALKEIYEKWKES